MSCKKIAQVLKNVSCSVHHLSLAQNSKFTQNSFQLDHKDQALDELEMRQSQLISGAVSGAAAADDAQPAPDASADAAKPGAADREPVVAMVTLSQEEREAFESLKEEVRNLSLLLLFCTQQINSATCELANSL